VNGIAQSSRAACLFVKLAVGGAHIMNIDELIAHYRGLIENNKHDIAEFESGSWIMGAMRNGERVDITSEWLVELRKRTADLEKIVAAHEARRPI